MVQFSVSSALALAAACSLVALLVAILVVILVRRLTKNRSSTHPTATPINPTPTPPPYPAANMVAGECSPFVVTDAVTGEGTEVMFDEMTLYWAGPKSESGVMSDEAFTNMWPTIVRFVNDNLPNSADDSSLRITTLQIHIGSPWNPTDPAKAYQQNYSCNADLLAESLLQIDPQVRIVVQTEIGPVWDPTQFRLSDDLSIEETGITSLWDFYGGPPLPSTLHPTTPGGDVKPDSILPSQPPCELSNYDERPWCLQNSDIIVWYMSYISLLMQRKAAAASSPVRRTPAYGISGLTWDTEDGGVGKAYTSPCIAIQMRQALDRHYGTLWNGGPIPLSDRHPNGFVITVAGHVGSNATVVTNNFRGCGQWWKTPVGGGAYAVKAEPLAQPELYWIGTKDMGNSAVVGNTVEGIAGGNRGFADTIKEMGFVSCPQSSPNHANSDNPYQYQCGCRQSVYEWGRNQTLSKDVSQNNTGVDKFCDIVTPLQTALINVQQWPLFSIERLGDANSTTHFANCATTVNFGTYTTTSDGTTATGSDAGFTCAKESNCIVRCGVANFFGGWSKTCFKRMLQRFGREWQQKLGTAPRAGIYEASFLPAHWVYTPAELEANPYPFRPRDGSASKPSRLPDKPLTYDDWFAYSDKYAGNNASKYFAPDAAQGSGYIGIGERYIMGQGLCPTLSKPFS